MFCWRSDSHLVIRVFSDPKFSLLLGLQILSWLIRDVIWVIMMPKRGEVDIFIIIDVNTYFSNTFVFLWKSFRYPIFLTAMKNIGFLAIVEILVVLTLENIENIFDIIL